MLRLVRLTPPSYHQGYAQSVGKSVYPGLWQGLLGGWDPLLGVDSDLRDGSSSKNHGVLQGDLATGWEVGAIPNADGYILNYDGTGDYIDAGDLSALFNSLSAFTVTVWIYPLTGSGASGIFHWWSANTGLILFMLNSGQQIAWQLDISSQRAVSGTTAITRDAWNFVLCEWDGSTNRIFINDVADGTTGASSYTNPPGGTTFRIGHNEGGLAFFLGKIGPVFTYDRVLSANEKTLLFERPRAPWELKRRIIGAAVAVATVAVSGTVTTGIDEGDITGVAQTTILTLTGDTWVAAGGTFDAQRQAIIDGCTSAQSEVLGWNNEVRDTALVAAVVRDSNTQVTITWATAQTVNYDITATETIEVTVPAAALVTSLISVVGMPTFTVDVVGVGVVRPVEAFRGGALAMQGGIG